MLGCGERISGKKQGEDGGSGHQEEALHVVSSNSVNVAQHRAIQDTADPLPLLLQPWQNQSLNHLFERKGEAGALGSPQDLPSGCEEGVVAHYDFMMPPSPSASPRA